MLKSLILATVVGTVVPGFASVAYACGGCATAASGSGDTCGMAGMDMSAAPATSAPAVAARTNRTYRSYSYEPSYGSVRSSRPMMRGSNSGVRGAASKAAGRYGR